MKNHIPAFIVLLIGVCLVGAPAYSESTIRKYILCRNGKTIRTLRVEKDWRGKQGWVTLYTKAGKDTIVGEGLNPTSCDDVLDRVQKTLETSSWKCKDISSSKIYSPLSENER